MSHIDSPLEKRAAAERARIGEAHATGALFKGGGGRVNERANVRNISVDRDGDGHISLLEKFDTDGDGKIEMHEYAATTNAVSGTAGGIAEDFAANSVGASAKVRQGWAKVREATKRGAYVPTNAERVRQVAEGGLVYSANVGGWLSPSMASGYQGESPVNNRNVRGNPFESRIFGRLPGEAAAHEGTHYAVASTADETYAYSGARGIFKNVGAESYVPAHYKAQLERQKANAPKAPVSPTLPGTSRAHRGGWPIEKSYLGEGGDLPGGHVSGWSIEKCTQPRPDNALFTRISPSL